MSVAPTSPLSIDYDRHPAFPEAAFVGQIDTNVLALLNEVYEQAIVRSPSATDTVNFVTLFRGFWSGLVDQYSDPITREFVGHLGRCSETLLLNQIRFLRTEELALSNRRETKQEGFLSDRYFFGKLRAAARTKAQAAAEIEADRFRAVAQLGRLEREDLSTNGGPSVRKIVALLNREFKRNGTFKLLKEYYGRRFCVLGLSLELSDHRASWWRHRLYESESPKTLYAHLDESIEFPKAILYLSHVAPESGPTSVYPGVWDDMMLNPIVDAVGRLICTAWRSNEALVAYLDDVPYHQTLGSAKFRQLFMSLPPSLRFNSHLGWDVIPGSELESVMASREKTLIGSSGTFVVFDGARLFHRGGLIESGDRVACQIIFGPRSERIFAKRVWNRARRDLRKFLKVG